MKHYIFYSWASDNPNSINRGFIEDALNGAVKNIVKDNNTEIDPVIDRDVQGLGGAPDIAKAIFEKIDRSVVFVADVSIINSDYVGRKTPNPNILFELGYALKKLGADKIILVMNTQFGKPELLPFDLKMRSVTTYQIKPEDKDKTTERKKLEKKLEGQLRVVLQSLSETKSSELAIKDVVKNLLSDPHSSIKLNDTINGYLQELADNIDTSKFSTENIPSNAPDVSSVTGRISKYDTLTKDFGQMLAILTQWSKTEHFYLFEKIFTRLAGIKKRSSDSDYYMWIELAWYPILVLIYFVGLSAVINNRYDVLLVLSKILVLDNSSGDGKQHKLISHVFMSIVGHSGDGFKMLAGKEAKLVPRSEHLFEQLKKPIIELFMLTEEEYDRYFDKTEVLLALICAEETNGWGSIGRFGWKHSYPHSSPFNQIVAEAKKNGKNWGPIRGGLFSSSPEKILEIIKLFEPTLKERSIRWG